MFTVLALLYVISNDVCLCVCVVQEGPSGSLPPHASTDYHQCLQQGIRDCISSRIWLSLYPSHILGLHQADGCCRAYQGLRGTLVCLIKYAVNHKCVCIASFVNGYYKTQFVRDVCVFFFIGDLYVIENFL